VSTPRTPNTSAFGSMQQTADVEPWDFYRHVEDAGGVVWDEGFGAWLVSRYDDVKEIGRRDEDVFELASVLDRERPMPYGLSYEQWVEFFAYGSPHFIATNTGETHTRQHRWWMRTFSARMLQHWRDSLIRPVADAQIDRFAAAGRAELVADFSARLAPRVMAGVMGLPSDDAWLDRLAELHDVRMALKQYTGRSGVPSDLVGDAFEATREIHSLLGPFVEERRSGETEDLIGLMWRDAPEIFGADWEEADIYGSAMAMWEGGAGSTPPSTSNALYLLASRPSLQDELHAADERALRNFVEESLRLFGPLYFRPRIVKKDVRLGEVLVREGEQVLPLTVAGSRDAERYACPASVDLARPAPRDHFSFFFGPRACPGHGLARVELEETVRAMLDRFSAVRLDPAEEPPRLTGLMARSWEPLHVVVEPR